MQKTGTPNEYRKELKKKILAYTMNEFVTKGIRAVKMDSVAKALGISKRTVYEIYKDKEDILVDGLASKFEDSHEKMCRIAAQSNNVIELLAEFYKMHMEDTSKACPMFISDVEKYPKATAFIKEMSIERDKQAIGFFERGIREGYFIENIDYDIILKLANNTSESIIQNQLFTVFPMQTLMRNMLILYLRGLCTLKGVELLDEMIG